MSSNLATGSAFVNSPLMASTSDFGSAPLRQSYPQDVGVQDAESGQDCSVYEQPAFTNATSNYLGNLSHANDRLHSPIFAPCQDPSAASAPYQRSPPLSLHSVNPMMTQELDLQPCASNPAWSSMGMGDMSCYEQQFSGQPVLSHHAHHQHSQPFAGLMFDIEFNDDQRPPTSEPQPSFDPCSYESSPYPELPSHESVQQHTANQCWQPPSDDDCGGSGDSGYDGKLNTSYAHLIYMCLLEAPNHSRKLKEIYDWIRIRTCKADDLTTNGWQNSVRHNLSMNKAFLKPSEAEGGKKLGYWRLDPCAIANGGVRPTSAHRAKAARNKSARKGAPAPQRANAGAKGGQATRDTRVRREGKHLVRQHTTMQRHFVPPPPQQQPYYSYPTPEHPFTDSSVENTPIFGAAQILTPAGTLSPRSTWQSPQPEGVEQQSELPTWNEFDFNDMHHDLPPTSDYAPPPMHHHGEMANPGTQFISSPTHDFHAGDTDEQSFSAFSHMSQFGFEGDEGIQGVLQRQLDEYVSAY